MNVRQRLRPGHFLPLKHLTRTEHPLELAHELFQMVSLDEVQRHQITIGVVEDFKRPGRSFYFGVETSFA